MGFARKRTSWIIAVAALAGLFALGMGTEHLITRASRSGGSDSIVPQAYAQVGAVGLDQLPDVVERVAPAVIQLKSKRIVRQQIDPFFQRFFGVPPERIANSLGSGVIVSADGYILTNFHMIEAAKEVTVELSDKRVFSAKIVGSDPQSDIAVLKIDAKDLPIMQLGDSDQLRVGQVVVAIGNPLGLSYTVTMGIVSALGRALGASTYEDLIQTDAAINPGNSGGALINLRGELVGINKMIVSQTGGSEGLGFAIPVNLAKSVMDGIVKYGKVVRGYLGVNPQNVTADLAETFGLEKVSGVLLTEVTEGGPADKAGIERGDVIVRFDGREIKNQNDFFVMVAETEPGKTVEVDVLRGGKPRTFKVKVVERPGGEEAAGGAEEQKGEGIMPLLSGVELVNLNDRYRQQLNLPDNVQGILVTAVEEGSVAGDAGLQRGMVIIEVNRKGVANLQEFNAAVKSAKGTSLLLLVYAGGDYAYVVLKE